MHRTHKPIHRHSRRGNLLVGCLSVLGVLLVIAIIATVFVVRSYRGWIATGVESSVDAVLVEMQLDDAEQGEVMGHVNTLMTRYKDKEIGLEELGRVFESIVESPLVGAAIIGGIDKLYLAQSDLSDEEKMAGRLQLARYAQGLREKSIDPETLDAVLTSVSTTTPDSDDIQLQFQQGPTGSKRLALRSADEVSDDDLRGVFQEAMTFADEAGVETTPAPIDISDELGVAIANALGEDPTVWVPGYAPPLPAAGSDEQPEEAPDSADEESDSDADGP